MAQKVMNPLLSIREWLIEPDTLQSLCGIDVSEAFFFEQKDEKKAELLSVKDGIGTISVSGPMIRKAGFIAKLFMGATDHLEIQKAVVEAMQRDDIKSVILDIDSPGGTVAGTPELAAAVAKLNDKKPVYAFTDGTMASAAYWIASQATAIYATPSARVGSIGVVQSFLDQSQRLERAGLKLEVFTVGRYKAMGMPGTSLTDEQRQLIESNLGEIAQDFHTAVLSKGRNIPPEAMEGQTFTGRQAERMGLSQLIDDYSEVTKRLNSYRATVDTKAQAMSDSLEQQLAEAQAKITTLEGEAAAQSTTLTEESAKVTKLEGEVAELATKLGESEAKVTELTEAAAAVAADKAALETAKAEFETAKGEFDKKVQEAAAAIVAKTGTPEPAKVSPASSTEQVTMTRDEFNKLDVAAQNKFFRDGGKLVEDSAE